MKTFWQHSLLRACLANAVAQTVIPQRAEEAFLVGLLQECGILLLVQVAGSSYATVCRSDYSPSAFYEVERNSFPYTHVNAISVMASEWRLPKIIAIPLELHHEGVQLAEGASEIEKLFAVSYFVGVLNFRSDALAIPEEAKLRQFGSANLGLDDTGWAHTQKRATDEYECLSTLFGKVLPDDIDVAELLGEANRRLTDVAADSERKALDVQVEHARIQREQKHLEQSLGEYRERAALDPLTNVLNRGALTEAAHQAIKANLDEGVPLGVFFLDIDNFKRLNDTYGHQVGDKVLKAIAGVLAKEIENRGPVGRYGGEAFVVLLRGLSAEGTREIAEHLVKRVRELDTNSLGLSGVVTCNVGAVWSDHLPVDSAEELFAAADQLMMIRRLVHEQQVGPLDDFAGQRQPLAPPAGQCFHRATRIVEPELTENDLDLRVVLMRPRGLIGDRIGQRRLHRGPVCKPILLRQEPDSRRSPSADFAGVRLNQAGQNLEKRRLSRSIGAQEPHMFIISEADGQTVE
jgi:diguanylate cyclase (GGDEF)-like protein